MKIINKIKETLKRDDLINFISTMIILCMLISRLIFRSNLWEHIFMLIFAFYYIFLYISKRRDGVTISREIKFVFYSSLILVPLYIGLIIRELAAR